MYRSARIYVHQDLESSYGSDEDQESVYTCVSDSASLGGDLSSREDQCHVFVSPQGSRFQDDVRYKDLLKFFKSKVGRGQVRYAIIVRNKSKKSRGFGRVKFTSHSVAKKAIATLNGQLFLGKYRLYIGFKREPEIKEVPFECAKEQMLYLSYCFFENLSKQILSLPAKVIKKASTIHLQGTSPEIESSSERLKNFLSRLNHRTVSYKYNSLYVRILEESFIPRTVAQSGEVTCLLKVEGQCQIHIHLFSHVTNLPLTLAFQKFQALEPQFITYDLDRDHVSYVDELALKQYISDATKRHNTIAVETEPSHLTIHGLSKEDIEHSWTSISERAGSTTITKSISIKLFQLKFIQGAHKDALQTDCTLRYPATFGGKDHLDTVYEIKITGMVSQLIPSVTKLDTLINTCVLESCTVQCPQRYLRLWRKTWMEFSETQKHNVIIEHTVESLEHSSSQTVKFDIYGARLDVLKVKEKVLTDGARTRSRVVALSAEELCTLQCNVVEACEALEESCHVYLSLGARYACITYPVSVSVDESRVTMKLKALIAAIPPQHVVRTLIIGDKQLADCVSTAWSSLIKQIEVDVSLTLQKSSILIKGTSEGIEEAWSFFKERLKRFQVDIKTSRLSLPTKYASIVSSLQFTSCVSDIESTAGVKCYLPTSEDVLEQVTIEHKDGLCTLQICKGSILLERVDAVVIPIEAQHGASKQATAVTERLMDLCGSTFKEEYTNHMATNKLTPGDFVKFSTDSPPFHTVFFVVVKPSDCLTLSLSIQKVLKVVRENQLGSMSFSIDAGLATDAVCRILLDEVDKPNCSLSLHTIRVVVPESQATSEQVYASVLHQYKQMHPLSIRCSSKQLSKHRWFWKDDIRGLVEYPQSVADELTKKWLVDQNAIVVIFVNRKVCTFDLQGMSKKFYNSDETREILHSTASSELKGSECIQWFYHDDSGSFSLYKKEQCEAIEKMYQDQSFQLLTIGRWIYTFDFENMHQINTRTKRRRPIKRQTGIKEVYIGIRGKDLGIKHATELIMSKLDSLLITKSIELPAGKDVSEQTVQDICQRQKYYVEILQTGRKLQMHGTEASVSGALTDIQAEIIALYIQREPIEWSPQIKLCELFEIAEGSIEWAEISSLFNDTMHDHKIISIKRVQNQLLWKKYLTEKEMVEKKNGGNANEKLLFHGSRKARAEDIVSSDSGQDVRFSSEGLWGKANYFAEKASYSDSYAYQYTKLLTIVKEVLVCRVITGDSIELRAADKSLLMPPEKEASVHLKKEHYDTVNGFTKNCRVYMTYDNCKSYPAYIIIYHRKQN